MCSVSITTGFCRPVLFSFVVVEREREVGMLWVDMDLDGYGYSWISIIDWLIH